MSKTIGINDLSSTLSQMLNEYSEFVTAETKKAIKKAGSDAAKELRGSSPKDKGDYAESWRSKTAAETSATIHVTVYAGNHQYSLTHLLENGHAKRGGGRVAAIKHIEPANEAALEKVLDAIERQL